MTPRLDHLPRKLNAEQHAAAIRLGRRQRAEQGLTEDITDPLVVDRVATILASGVQATRRDTDKGAA